ARRRIEPGQGGVHAPLPMMDRLVLHEFPCEDSECEWSAIPVDRCADVHDLQCGNQVAMLLIERGEKSLSGQRAVIVLMLSRPIHLLCRQRGVVDAASADEVPHLLAERREAVANSTRWWRTVRSARWNGREVPLVFRDCAHKIHGQAVKNLAVP